MQICWYINKLIVIHHYFKICPHFIYPTGKNTVSQVKGRCVRCSSLHIIHFDTFSLCSYPLRLKVGAAVMWKSEALDSVPPPPRSRGSLCVLQPRCHGARHAPTNSTVCCPDPQNINGLPAVGGGGLAFLLVT